MSRSQKSIKNISAALIGQSFGLIISFVARIVFIRILGTEYLGLNGLFSNILTILSLAELGIGEAITYSLYKPLSESNIEKCKMIMNFYKKTYIAVGCIILVLGLTITPALPFLISNMPDIKNINLIYILFVINTSCSYFFSYKRNLIIADQNKYITIIYRYLFYFILNIIQIIYLIKFRDYIGFLIIQILFTLLENISVSIKANKMYYYLKDKNISPLDKKSKNQIIRNTKAMMMHKIGGVIVDSTDNLLLSSFVGLTAVGLYSNYYLIISALNTIFKQFFGSINASIGNLIVSSSEEKAYSIFKKIFFANFWIYAMASICLICLFNPFIELWLGKEYLLEFNVVIILVINFFITGMRRTVVAFKEAAGLFYQDRWKAIIEGIVNLIVSIILAIKFGTLGVFLGTLISTLSVCVWFEALVLFKYEFKKSFLDYIKIYVKYIGCTIFIGLVVYSICLMINAKSIITFTVRLVITFIFTNFMIFIIYRKSEEFKYFYEKILKKFTKKI